MGTLASRRPPRCQGSSYSLPAALWTGILLLAHQMGWRETCLRPRQPAIPSCSWDSEQDCIR